MIRAPKNFWNKVDQSGGPDACWPWTGRLNAYGYGASAVVEDGKWRNTSASAVAHFLTTGCWERASEGRCVRHRCDARPCCNPAHLVGGATAENARDKAERGAWRGSRVHAAKLDEAKVLEIRRAAVAGRSMRSLAREYGVAFSAIQQSVAGYTWRHVAEAVEIGRRVGEAAGTSKLTAEKVRAIRVAALAGRSLRPLAKEYGVAFSTVQDLVSRKTWKHVE